MFAHGLRFPGKEFLSMSYFVGDSQRPCRGSIRMFD